MTFNDDNMIKLNLKVPQDITDYPNVQTLWIAKECIKLIMSNNEGGGKVILDLRQLSSLGGEEPVSLFLSEQELSSLINQLK